MKVVFSIVIPLFNKENYIGRTIESVLNQSYKDFEVIIVDDGSTDGSISTINHYSDNRIRLIHQKNAGVSSARNTGIESSNHEYIAFLDADDWWDEHYLSKMKLLIETYPEISFYASQYIRVYKNRHMISMNIIGSDQQHAIINPLSYGIDKGLLPLHTSSVVVKKSILGLSGLFDNRISYYEDYDLFLRILRFSSVAFSSGASSFYNLDVNPAHKITGKLPPITKHFVFYTNKIDKLFKNDKTIKLFIDRFTITNLLLYYRAGIYKKETRQLKIKIDSESFSFKDKFLFFIPYQIADMLIKTKMKLNELLNKDLA